MLKKIIEKNSIQSFQKVLHKEPSLLFESLWDAAKAVLSLLSIQSSQKNLLIISGGERETRLFDDLKFFFKKNIYAFPDWEILPGEEILPSPDIIGKRFEILEKLIQPDNQPHIVITTLQGLMQKICFPNRLKENILHIKQGDTILFDTLSDLFISLGYRRERTASDKGEFAIHGGIVDIFPVSSFNPYRLDFFGDELEEIRVYDPISQKSISKEKEIILFPAQEKSFLENEESLCTLLEYLGKETVVIFDDILSIEDQYVSLKDLPGIKPPFFLPFSELFQAITSLQTIYFTDHPLEDLSDVTQETDSVFFEIFNQSIQTKRIKHPFISIESFFWNDVVKEKRLEAVLKKNVPITFITSSTSEENALKKKVPSHPNYTFEKGYLSSGFVLEEDSFIILPYPELSKRYKISRQKWRNTYHTPASEFHNLEKGDLVVHLHNGIGKFLGIEIQKNHLENEEEFLILEYANSSRLYVPLSQSHLISRYIGTHSEVPRLNILGTKKWQQAKNKAQKAIIGYAQDLLNIQAARESKGGYVYPKDSDDMFLFEDEFPFVETQDQLQAIKDIKTDMESEKAMDRLICGDVGYGKTEVAMRAAFKSVIDGGKQVAVLVPTTILAMQHYETFKERMINFPVNIGVASRFIKPKELKKTLEGIAKGSVDILIGTQRIISKDIQFKNLGLIIIDEEQRFGVRAKEHFKKAKTGVECLTLSATPIPRTLYFSLIGARDMSIINTPPQDRLPIKSILAERDSEVIKNALLREITRGGQAYFMHNRVETIFKVAEEIRAIFPDARVSVGHGQMGSIELDTIFHQFKEGKIDILVATTIIENGIDIPNANTILIDRSHTLGMADLYQLRGRVGRWNRSAYAYFLVPKNRELMEISRKRLQALIETSGFGGGMKLAMRDLEIRGAGDLLGVQQSGNVSAIGFHFYCKLLKRTIDTLKKEVSPNFFDTRMEFSYNANLPSTYIPETNLRMEIYHRLGETTSNEQITTLTEELIDRFGPLPCQTKWLMALSRIRIFASIHQFHMLKFDKVTLYAKREHRKKLTEKTIFLPIIKDPEEFEFITIGFLRRDFELP